MAAKYILAALSVAFLVTGLLRRVHTGGPHPQSRTWLLVGAIFGAVSLWLFSRG